MQRSLLALLGALSPVIARYNLEDNPNAVSSCYSVWHSLAFSSNGSIFADLTDVTNGEGDFGPALTYQWWGRPDGGYYMGSNRTIYDRHFEQMTDAGIDFIIIDATNAYNLPPYQPGLFTEPTDVLLDEMIGQRFLGGKQTPYVVLWMHYDATDGPDNPYHYGPLEFVRERYYGNSRYDDLWVYYDGLPLVLTTMTPPTNYTDIFTLRKLWGLEPIDENGEWSYLTNYPQAVGTYNGVAEQISVSVAKEGNTQVNAAPFSDESTATPRLMGATYQQQWSRAFDTHPKLVTLTWWNQWIAILLAYNSDGSPVFVDEWISEYSNDIEPQDPTQETGHGSKYLEWTKQYISAYKANEPMPQGLTGY